MSGTVTPPKGAAKGTHVRSTAVSTPVGRVRALARAELTLLGRSKGTLFAALFVPVVVPFSLRTAADEMDLAGAGLSVGTLIVPAAIGFSLLFAVYAALVGVFVTRREELVLKRLRTGELRDAEILTASSLPSGAIGLAQSLLLAVGCALLMDMAAPQAVHLAVLGLLLGLVLSAGLAAVTASFTRTAESAQVTSMPVILVSVLASGMTVPLEILPDRLASICALLPFTPVMTLVRGGFTGNLSGSETLFALTTGVAWTLVSVFAVRRWFRWEPRR
ncbi:ABC transporter permease [Streptomyces sp. KMM 9044]|uniref:ABC transporter permease n=1 Tax=Streptomyces sp. KMM 9044 TaxID=2744474 RepID=UPI002151E6E0|nr:ABC transporter permease [Streptomyces sp. KMM 9044]WAX79223.1 ABC transporter permease [Streptomyces sp. KMM 9044]